MTRERAKAVARKERLVRGGVWYAARFIENDQEYVVVSEEAYRLLAEDKSPDIAAVYGAP